MKSLITARQDSTNPILAEAVKIMKIYARSTGTYINVYNSKGVSIPELLEESTTEKTICDFCMKYRNSTEGKSNLKINPCQKMHLNAIKESHRFGGSYTYMCDLGFLFWTSPIYKKEQFIGSLLASGYLGVDREETILHMQRFCGGMVSKAELMKKIEEYPRGDPVKVKALAKLLLVCAGFISTGDKFYHTVIDRRARQQINLSAKIEEIKNRYPADGPQPEYPIDREEKLIEALRSGDADLSREILNEILAVLLIIYPDQFKSVQYRASELAVLLLRTYIGQGLSSEIILETNYRYFETIQEATNIEELSDALYRIVDDMAAIIFTFQGIRHAAALKKAEHYLLENYARKISLREIAKIAGFSAPYFSTIFKEEMGENFSRYLNRLRVEKAGYLLVNTNYSLSKITRVCGFEDQSWFSKIFKIFTGISPGKYRNQGGVKR